MILGSVVLLIVFVLILTNFWFEIFPVGAYTSQKWLAFGDSITFGESIGGNNYAYPKKFADAKGYSMTNYGISGDRSVDLLGILNGNERHYESYPNGHTVTLQEINSADGIMVCIGANDVLHLAVDAVMVNPISALIYFESGEFESDVDAEVVNFSSNFPIILSKLTNNFSADGVKKLTAMTVFNPYRGAIVPIIKTINVPFVGETNITYNFDLGAKGEYAVNALNAAIKSICQGHGIKVFDMYADFQNYAGSYQDLIIANPSAFNINDTNNFMQYFDPHPTVRGQTFIAEKLAAFLTKGSYLSNPAFVLPINLTAEYGSRLLSILLPVNWEWDNPNILLMAVGAKIFSASYRSQNFEYDDGVGIDLLVNVRPKDIGAAAPAESLDRFEGGLYFVV
jgi:lysophospholipase L1-like esterase